MQNLNLAVPEKLKCDEKIVENWKIFKECWKNYGTSLEKEDNRKRATVFKSVTSIGNEGMRLMTQLHIQQKKM